MTHQPPTNDPKNIWRNYNGGYPTMSLQDVQQRAKRRQEKARREIVIDGVLNGVTLSVSIGVLFKVHGTPARAILSIVILFLLAGTCRLLRSVFKAYGTFWPKDESADAGSATSIVSYRRDLERQRKYTLWPAYAVIPAGTSKGWLPVFVLIGILPTVLIAARRPELLRSIWPLAVLLPICSGLVLFARQRVARRIQREIDDLAAFERN